MWRSGCDFTVKQPFSVGSQSNFSGSGLFVPAKSSSPALRKLISKITNKHEHTEPWPPLRALTFSQSHRGVFGIDRVQDSFIANLGLRNQTDFAAEIRRPAAHGVSPTARRSEQKQNGRSFRVVRSTEINLQRPSRFVSVCFPFTLRSYNMAASSSIQSCARGG